MPRKFDMNTSPVRCSHFTLGNPKKIISTVLFIHTPDCLRYTRRTHTHKYTHLLTAHFPGLLGWAGTSRKQTVIQLPTPTWKYHHTNLWIAKLFHLTEGLLRSFRCWRLWGELVVDCHRWLWKEPVVMCGNWNVRQAMLQQVSRVTTFGVNTCFQFFRHWLVA